MKIMISYGNDQKILKVYPLIGTHQDVEMRAAHAMQRGVFISYPAVLHAYVFYIS